MEPSPNRSEPPEQGPDENGEPLLRVPAGSFLAAWPDLRDPNFAHSVVLMCQHDGRGAYGLVVNRLLGLSVADLVPEHPLLGKLATPTYLGGPVDHTQMQFLHRVPDRISGGVEISEGVYLGGEVEELAQELSRQQKAPGEDADDVRLVVGYSGWSAGQLDGELAQGAWLPALADPRYVFEGEGEDTWRAVVRTVRGGDSLGNTAPEVDWN
jgi:putative transcriptional regulator